MMHNLTRRVMLMLAPDGAAGGDAGNGSADDGTPAPGNAENQLASAFEGASGAEGEKPAAQPKPGDTAAGGKQTEGVKLAAWTEQLPPEIKGNPDLAAKLAQFGKVGDITKAYFELEGKSASADAAKPKSAQEYSFAKDTEHDGTVFAEAAFKANLSTAQADALFKNLGEIGLQKAQAIMQAQAQQRSDTAAALAAEYGSKYQEKMELLKRGLAQAGPNVGRLISQAGLAGNPEIIKAFIAFGQMTAESGFVRGSGAGGTMESILDGGTFEYKT